MVNSSPPPSQTPLPEQTNKHPKQNRKQPNSDKNNRNPSFVHMNLGDCSSFKITKALIPFVGHSCNTEFHSGQHV